jgi:hypothetical protein
VEPRAQPRASLAWRRPFLEETLPVCRATRCRRFDDVKPRAPARGWGRERLSALRETRCERFDDVEPRAPARTPQREERFAFRETRSPLRETRLRLRETRCERFDVVEPRASPLHGSREARCQRFDVVEPLAPGGTELWETRSMLSKVAGSRFRELVLLLEGLRHPEHHLVVHVLVTQREPSELVRRDGAVAHELEPTGEVARDGVFEIHVTELDAADAELRA